MAGRTTEFGPADYTNIVTVELELVIPHGLLKICLRIFISPREMFRRREQMGIRNNSKRNKTFIQMFSFVSNSPSSL